MQNRPLRFDNLWANKNAVDLKRMATVWGASSKLPKDECIAYLRSAMANAREIDAAFGRMLPHERKALSLMKLVRGAAELQALEIAAAIAGVESDATRRGTIYDRHELGRRLVERGIVMVEAGHYYSHYGASSANVPVFVDDRVLDRTRRVDFRPLQLDTVEAPPTASFRRAQSVVLDVISIVRAVEGIGGIGFTKTGEMRVNDVRKFARKMDWGTQVEIDGLIFPEPGRAFVRTMANGGLLTEKGGVLVPAAPLEQIGIWPVTSIIHGLVGGVTSVLDWCEYEPDSSTYWYVEHCARARFAALAALRCLPDRFAWYRLEEFERCMFNAIGGIHSLGSIPHAPYLHNKSKEEQAAENEKWRQEIRNAWDRHDVPWLRAAFRTWLFAFGIIEVHIVDGIVERFRLTDAGRAVLWDEPMEKTARPSAEPASPWIVQPNFDVVLYLDTAATEQIAFLEQHAERVRTAQHTAQYRLTRDSVYEGLQRGTGVDSIIAALAAGSRVELPTNVVAEIRSWSFLRERIQVRRADLVEFPDGDARQSAITRGFKGQPEGDRYALLPGSYGESRLPGLIPAVFDYADKRVARCLHISEDGVVSLSAKHCDMVTVGWLDLWAERAEERPWRLTRASVSETIRRGRTLTELLAFLLDRNTNLIPKLLIVALNAWAGKPAAAELGEVVVLRCGRSDVLEAMVASSALNPYLLTRLGPDTILVNSADVDSVKAILEWAGIEFSTKLTAV